ncbi:MAG: 3-phosphoshikimate 1-carboxyvinyltransferase [Deltaproteobacteria bacterium]|nr:3-phosphoshikimate 1-carboxyvinyltransferase [Deltaproteobacteria bacterium]MBW2116843.1 3-phosphoshikimate 1-carboxyvinyltransferase [Deltaproteobacteria bacterium]
MKEINPRSKLHGTVRIPGSKSITHRAIIAASLAHGRSVLKDFLECEDTLYTINALRKIGVEISINRGDLEIQGRGGGFSHGSIRKEIYLGNSGTSFRLLLSVVALCSGEFFITGAKRMKNRPIGPLVASLSRLGVDASWVDIDGCPPVFIRAKGIQGGRVSMEGNQSSQFLSSLLLSGPYADNDIKIEIIGDLVSKPYVDITIDVMKEFGIRVERDDYSSFNIPSGRKYRAREFAVQGDASSASYFWAAAAVTGGTITTDNIYPQATRQGDIRFLEILDEMGCFIEKGSDNVTVHGGDLSGIEADMGDLPDMVPTLAAVALFAKGRTIIQNVPHLKLKESNRLHALAVEWSKLGGRVEELSDSLIIHGGERLSGKLVDTHDDHRLAMSLAVVGLRVPGVRIRDEECVNKSFPQFWDIWDQLQGNQGNPFTW